jgi:cobalamin synthase
MNNHLKSIRRNSAIGLWGSVAAVIIAALFYYISPYRFYPSQSTSRWMLIAGSVLAVLALSASLLVVRKQIPSLRQSEGLETKLAGYAQHIRSLYLNMLAVVVIICVLMVLSSQNVLLMLAIVSVMMLFLAYPNIYRIKTDLGLTDGEAATLFGDKYISDNREQ